MQFLLINLNALHLLAISFLLYLLVVFRDYRRRGGLPYPPGPRSWPIIGNILSVPKEAPWIAYADMSKIYGMCRDCGTRLSQLKSPFEGDVICFRFLSEVVVILNSSSALKDLLEKRGQTYSERPSLPIIKMYILLRFIFPSQPSC